MNRGSETVWRPAREADLAPAVARHLEGLGYQVWVDPDGSDYFDIVARRGNEVGLVELKLSDWRSVLSQAQRRRGWGDWVAVAVPRASIAQRILRESVGRWTEKVGVWRVRPDGLDVLRHAMPLRYDGEDPFAPLRAHLRESLDLLADGVLPPGTGWRFLRMPRPKVGRETTLSTALWRLEEFGPSEGLARRSDASPAVSRKRARRGARSVRPSSTS
jgi:hypothetical protein